MDSQVATRYVCGESACSLAKEFGYSKQSVLEFLRKRDITIRSSKEVVRALSDRGECELVDQYLDGLSINKLHKQLGISLWTVSAILARHGIKTRSLRESVRFADVTTPTSGNEFFYYLGLLLSDGWIYEREYSILAGLGMRDDIVINFIRDSFSPQRKVYFDGTLYRILLPITAEYRDFLASWGCVRRKSLILQPTEKLLTMVDEEFYQMLVGIIEGDGSVIASTKAIQLYSGSREFCSYILTKIGFGQLWVDRRRNKRKKNDSYMCRWSDKQARILASSLLSCKLLKLNRKWDIARSF